MCEQAHQAMQGGDEAGPSGGVPSSPAAAMQAGSPTALPADSAASPQAGAQDRLRGGRDQDLQDRVQEGPGEVLSQGGFRPGMHVSKLKRL